MSRTKSSDIVRHAFSTTQQTTIASKIFALSYQARIASAPGFNRYKGKDFEMNHLWNKQSISLNFAMYGLQLQPAIADLRHMVFSSLHKLGEIPDEYIPFIEWFCGLSMADSFGLDKSKKLKLKDTFGHLADVVAPEEAYKLSQPNKITAFFHKAFEDQKRTILPDDKVKIDSISAALDFESKSYAELVARFNATTLFLDENYDAIKAQTDQEKLVSLIAAGAFYHLPQEKAHMWQTNEMMHFDTILPNLFLAGENDARTALASLGMTRWLKKLREEPATTHIPDLEDLIRHGKDAIRVFSKIGLTVPGCNFDIAAAAFYIMKMLNKGATGDISITETDAKELADQDKLAALIRNFCAFLKNLDCMDEKEKKKLSEYFPQEVRLLNDLEPDDLCVIAIFRLLELHGMFKLKTHAFLPAPGTVSDEKSMDADELTQCQDAFRDLLPRIQITYHYDQESRNGKKVMKLARAITDKAAK